MLSCPGFGNQWLTGATKHPNCHLGVCNCCIMDTHSACSTSLGPNCSIACFSEKNSFALQTTSSLPAIYDAVERTIVLARVRCSQHTAIAVCDIPCRKFEPASSLLYLGLELEVNRTYAFHPLVHAPSLMHIAKILSNSVARSG